MNDLAIVIPCRNEIRSIFKILNKLKRYKVILVNDRSTDGLVEGMNKYKNITLINNKKQIGYEKSILKGFKYLLKSNHKKIKYILTMDADGEHNPVYVSKIHKKIKSNNFDLIIGNRSKKNRKSEIIISQLFKKKYNFEDPLSGFKIYNKKKLFHYFPKCKEKFFLTELCVFFAKSNYKISNFKIITKKNLVRISRINNSNIDKKILNIKKLLKN